MSRTEDLKKFLTRELKTICENVCYQQASDDIPFPYIVYDLSHKQYEVGKGYSIEINIWDRSTSTKNVEMIADDTEYLFDDTIYNENTFTASIDLNTRNTVEDSDKRLKRRRLLFDMLYYD